MPESSKQNAPPLPLGEGRGEGNAADANPTVSIILPTFNRAKFLPEAFAAIAGQQWTDWELIVVDDGSTDNTRELVPELTRGWQQPVRYIHQENQGPAAARNQGISQARGEFIAFYDSDDLWLPHHLARCVDALQAYSELHWVYGACRLMDLETGVEIQTSSFHPGRKPHPFLKLRSRKSGNLVLIEDEAATSQMIASGLMCGLQGSVLRRQVFDRVSIPHYRIAEDQVFVVQVLKAGFRLGYFDDVHVVYRVHDECSSARFSPGKLDKAVSGLQELIGAYEALPQTVTLNAAEQLALRRRLANEWFWTLGYSLLWQNGRRQEAIGAFRIGLKYWPWDWRLWKTYLIAFLRNWLGENPPPASRRSLATKTTA
jgi:glycosyltransferase involved in cell wall biosynthesis